MNTIFKPIFAAVLSCVFFGQSHATKLVSWNMEWLTSSPNHNILETKRQSHDIDELAKIADETDTDILAFQEVNDAKVLGKILGDGYNIIFSQRKQDEFYAYQFRGTNQYTGFAVKKGLEIQNQTDLMMASSPKRKLRFATYIMVNIQDQEIHLLSVHLKAGCRGKYKNTVSCNTLKKEAISLHDWIKERVKKRQLFIISGDFNHNLSYPGDWLFRQISGNQDKYINLSTKNTRADCKVRSRKNKGQTYQYKSLIDHVIASEELNLKSPKQYTYNDEDVLRFRLSDHCPLMTTFN